MHPILNIAVRAARSAGNIILRASDRIDSLTIETKSNNDFVTEIDRKAEQEIIHTIRQAYPDHAILAEESGADGKGDFEWIIDPLDGTTNFLHGFPQYCVSIAFRQRGRLDQAVVYDPLRQELFTASRGNGALLNDHRIRVSSVKKMELALLGTGFPYKDMYYIDSYLPMLKDMLATTSGVRRAGSAALDLAYVAAGRLDGFWEMGLQPWDMAAGVLLVQEAGGMVSGLRGDNDFLDSGHIVATNARLFKPVLQTIRPHLTSIIK